MQWVCAKGKVYESRGNSREVKAAVTSIMGFESQKLRARGSQEVKQHIHEYSQKLTIVTMFDHMMNELVIAEE